MPSQQAAAQPGQAKRKMSSLLKSVPDSWGAKFEGSSGAVTRTQTGPNAIEFTAAAHMALVLFTPQPDREIALNSDRKSSFLAPAGSLEIIPATADFFARWHSPKENLLLALGPHQLNSLAELEFQRSDFELRPPKEGFIDEKARMIAQMIREEFRKEARLNDLYLDSLITVFSTHLLRDHSSLQQLPVASYRGGLSTRVWKDIDEYIHAGISDDLSIEKLARLANLSPSHFLRAFRQTTGQPPHQYILTLRLSLAERMIVETDTPFAQIAKLVGFASHSHMSATMKRHRLVGPSDLRRRTRTSITVAFSEDF
ncbi:helix-turn-helix domain-containing protein [Mesorhizobium sp. ASY16-5R]|uniref:AraC family transcriptional regulator n=1 Tax=Mesorhizobium sp. ASY16-5R TaxID=3445772 RepID=UPI003FA16FFF